MRQFNHNEFNNARQESVNQIANLMITKAFYIRDEPNILSFLHLPLYLLILYTHRNICMLTYVWICECIHGADGRETHDSTRGLEAGVLTFAQKTPSATS